jgi:hypothetical protein
VKPSILALSAPLSLLCALSSGCYGAPDSSAGDAGDDTGSADDGATDGADDGEPSPTTASTDPGPDPDPSGDDSGGPEPSDDSDGSADAGDTGEPGTSGGEEVDTTPPTVMSTIPADQAVGVAADVVLSVTFSEPMDKASVQAAYQSEDLPASMVTMSWNETGDQLIVTPNAPLWYGNGSSPEDATYVDYAFSIGTAAADLAGNELQEDVHVAFTTLAHITEVIPVLGALSGGVRVDGTTVFSVIQAGDSGNPPNLQWKGFASFPLYDLPDDMVQLVEARLFAHQHAVAGTPYADLGNLEVHDVEFFSIGDEAFSAPSGGSLGEIADHPADTVVNLVVTEAVAADLDAGLDTTQFCLQFPTPVSVDGAADYVLLHSTDDPDTGLEVEYLIP